MNLELFPSPQPSLLAGYETAFNGWVDHSRHAGLLRRTSSEDVYRSMWLALATWAVGRGLALPSITAADLEVYLASRAGPVDLSPRYALRLVRLVDRVLALHLRSTDGSSNAAAAEFVEARPEIRFANASDADPLVESLSVPEAAQLVSYLSQIRSAGGRAGQPWQEVRNRASVGLMLGAGVTPGEVRALKLTDVVVQGGRNPHVPWKLRVAGKGRAPARETPVAPWAGQLLRFWLDVRGEQGIPGGLLFVSTGAGKPWGKVAQYNAAKAVMAAAGLEEGAGGSFKLRHTFALRQLRRGQPPAEVERWLGVSDPAVMARYRRVLVGPVDVV